MENKQKTIKIPLPDVNSATDLSDESQRNALELAQLRMDSITEKVTESLQIGQAILNTLCPALEDFGNMIIKAQEFAVAMKPLLEIIQQISVSFAKAILDFQIPSLSEERKQELLESHQKWGKLGWTWFQNAPFYLYNSPPLDVNDANSKVKSFCSPQSVESIFDDLRRQNIKKSDLESAIFCYHNRQYKACSLLLFSLIDAKIIRKQSKDKPRRPVGVTAVRNLRGQFEENKNEQMFFTMLCYANLFACLETIFENGHDFKCEPVTINRNFVDHGMNQRRVRKRDCIQLFLVLNNLMYFLDDSSKSI